jgi:hypothetical protein
MTKPYNLNLNKRHEQILGEAKNNNFKIKREIWKVLKINIEIWGDDNKFLLKKIYLDIIKKGFMEVDIETKLARSGFEILNDVIDKEYKMILEQQNKIETLEREKNFYKSMCETYNKDLNERIIELLK